MFCLANLYLGKSGMYGLDIGYVSGANEGSSLFSLSYRNNVITFEILYIKFLRWKF